MPTPARRRLLLHALRRAQPRWGRKINHFLFPCFQPFSLSGLTAERNCRLGESRQSCSQLRTGRRLLTQENCKNKSENDLPGLKCWAQHWALLESKQPCTAPHLTLLHGHRTRTDFFLFKAGDTALRPPPRGCRPHCHALPGYFQNPQGPPVLANTL